MEKTILIFLCLFYGCYGVIYNLNNSDYSRMPPIFHLEDYEYCLVNSGGLYCTVDIDIIPDTTNDVFNMIRNYSDYTKKHFNHTRLHHGICVTQSCKEYFQNSTTDLKSLLERCLNESIWKKYQLETKISEPIFCNNDQDSEVMDSGDIAMCVFLLGILIINIIGSLYDVIFVKSCNTTTGNGLLLCFSVQRNFARLGNSFENLSSHEKRLKSFHGLKTITIMIVICAHSLLPFGLLPENPHHFEMMFDNIFQYVFLNGTIIVQTFFIMSGCLLSYKLELYLKANKIHWTLLPKAIIILWAKLTPSYAVTLGLTCTLMRYAGMGPFWNIAVMTEVNDCRQNGWANLLYVNNYLDYSHCMVQTWFVGSIMQLYILGFIIFLFSKKIRKAALIFFFIVGVIAPGVHTYVQDLDVVVIVTPEIARTYMHDPTFNNVYTRGHTNVVNFILGMALGILICRLQMDKVDMSKYQKYRFLLWLTAPAIPATMFLSSVFYMDSFNTPLIVKAIYASVMKPIFGLVISTLIIGNVFKIDNTYRWILEWNGWRVPARLSYCAYIIHIFWIRIATGNNSTLVPFGYLRMIEFGIASIVISFLAALPLWLLIDAPFAEFCKKIVSIDLFHRKKSENIIPALDHIHLKRRAQTLVRFEEEKSKL